MKLSPYAKAVASAVITVAYVGLVAWQGAVSGHHVQWPMFFPVVAAVGGAVLTYVVPITPDAPYLKTVVTGVLQGVAAVAVLFQNQGVTPNLLAVLLAVAGTFAVHKTSNGPVAAREGAHEA